MPDQFVSAASRHAALLGAVLVVSLAVTGCGRKGGLEVPGGMSQPRLATLEPTVRPADTLVTASETAPPLRDPIAPDAELRAADIRGANADAPEPGDAIPEGPTVGAQVPRKRFLLDFLL